jgi:hypothetical protein
MIPMVAIVTTGGPPYNVIAAILAGVIVRAWWVWDKRRAAERAARPVVAQVAPARTGWRYSWRAWAIVGLAAYAAIYAIAYTVGIRIR